MDHYAPKTRKEVEANIDTEIVKVDADRRQILRSIFEASHIADFSDSARLQCTIARFATLLVSLSIQADRIQRWMIGLTVAIAVMTLVLMVLTGIMLAKV
jgi:hypothetical protein